MSDSTSLTIIAICQLLTLIAGIVTMGALVWVFFAFKKLVSKKIDEAIGLVKPVADQAKAIAEQARKTADTACERVDTMMSRMENTVDAVGDKVEDISARVEEAISPQMIAAAGVVGTAAKAAQIYRDIKKVSQESKKPDACEE
jgi:methyl-accepting chemotaxis protein